MSQVVKFVHAYRQLGRPALSTDTSFSFASNTFLVAVSEAIQSLRDSKAGRFNELLINGQDTNPLTFDFSNPWSSIEFSFTLETSGTVPVFRNFEQLIARSKSLVRNQLPPHFYLIDDNILSSEKPIDQRVDALQTICKLIVYLADLAHFHDEKELSDEYKLVFMTEDAAKGERAITLYPYLDLELLSYEVGTELLDSLQGKNLDDNPNLLKERSIFRTSLIEHLSGPSGGKERFKTLITTWSRFRALYENNLSTYLSGFSFHKAKQEVAMAQLAIAEQMSKVVSDMSGKVLSVPVSLVAIIAISKAEGVLESSILVLGITIMAALLAETLAAQKLQFERVKHSRAMMFSAHQQRLHQYPQDLRDYLKQAIEGLNENETKLGRSLRTLRSIAWIPAIAAVALHGHLYQAELQDTLVKLYEAVKSPLSHMRCAVIAVIGFS